MSGWVKTFKDHIEMGLDSDVAQGKASWSKGQLSEMTGACISINCHHVSIQGFGKYWQEDDFVSSPDGSNVLVARRIMKELRDGDRLVIVLSSEHSLMLKVVNLYENVADAAIADDLVVLNRKDVNKWLVVELNVISNIMSYYIKDSI